MKTNKDSEKEEIKSRIMTLTIKAVVLNRDNEVLILKRSRNNLYGVGKYDLPGGHIQENESYKDAISREVKEETGLDVIFEAVIDVVEFPEGTQQFRDEKRGIRCICLSHFNEVKLSPEHEQFKWLPIEKALDVFSQADGFENEKRNTLLEAKSYLEMKKSLDGWKRCLADFENYKKRQMEEKKDMVAYSNLNLILELLPVVDNFHASTEHIPAEQKDNPWVTGIMHIQKQLEKILEDNGISEIVVKKGDEFDPATMEAISHEAQNTKREAGESKVKKVLVKGYRIDERVVRAARVVVE
ncbi:MAG: nucleotide exchange factor GrpE [Candidatus Pacebacteria bacterium]|nr:nucleotide exchange factor GrpE [Candidatus Paceibacterota bacterium]MDR3583485.1 nucleotide exchange factor GrpE [Candidatus Paceibacterota bacterium]